MVLLIMINQCEGENHLKDKIEVIKALENNKRKDNYGRRVHVDVEWGHKITHVLKNIIRLPVCAFPCQQESAVLGPGI